MHIFIILATPKKFDFLHENGLGSTGFPFEGQLQFACILFDRIDIILNLDIDNSLKYFYTKLELHLQIQH